MAGATDRRIVRFEYLSDGSGPGDDRARFGWRVLAANNRPLGRAVAVESTLERSRASAAALHERTDETSAAITLGGHGDLWAWQVVLDGDLAAVCVHPYQRRVECARGLAQFLAAVRLADPATGPVRHFGPHSLRLFGVEVSATGAGS